MEADFRVTAPVDRRSARRASTQPINMADYRLRYNGGAYVTGHLESGLLTSPLCLMTMPVSD
jgi:hypothetical protein